MTNNLKLDSDIAISVKNLTKVYHLYDKPQDRLKEALNPFKKSYHHDFYALNDVSFEIKKGETVGIIGKNGAGKSTLLKIITGVLTSTSGEVQANGKIASLLELGAGFNPEMTGIENIYLNGTIMGFTKEEMDKKVDAILEFADIGEFVYQPVKMYSSGMFARLAFSVAINVEPDILIVDEVLSVGDIRFQQKSIRKMEEFSQSGKTILFVTHDMGTVNSFCSNVIWIDKAKLHSMGNSETIVKKYITFMSYGEEVGLNQKEDKRSKNINNEIDVMWESTKGCESFGEGGVEILETTIIDKQKRIFFKGNDEIIFAIKLYVIRDIKDPIVGFLLRDRYGNAVTGANNIVYATDSKLESFKGDSFQIIKFKMKLPGLANGVYLFSPAIAEGKLNNHTQLHWVDDAKIIEISNNNEVANMGWNIHLEDVTIESMVIKD